MRSCLRRVHAVPEWRWPVQRRGRSLGLVGEYRGETGSAYPGASSFIVYYRRL